MKRGVLACTVLLACLAVGSLVLAARSGDGGAPPKETRPSAHATLSSRSILFGDTVEARLDLIVPRNVAGIEFQGHPNFSPFRILSSHVERDDLGGGLERVLLRYELACLSQRCVTAEPSARVQFRPTDVAIPGGGSLHAVWPSLLQVSRAENVSAPVSDGLDTGPAGIPGLQPRLDTDEALGAAAVSLVVLLSLWLVLRARVRRRLAAIARRGTVLQALLARVEAGLPEDVVYRQRHALDALAVELRQRRIDGGLAIHAERLAWSPEQPDPAEIRSLCAEVRRMARA